MAIIKKRADKLQPGDVLPANGAQPRRVVQWVETYRDGQVCWGTADLKRPGLTPPQMPTPASVEFDVEAPDAWQPTPAQERAEALVDLVQRAETWLSMAPQIDGVNPWLALARTVLGQILVPPTLAEALLQMQALVSTLGTSNEPTGLSGALEVLDRARRAGLL
jgi:hypothetical protein